MAFSFPRPATLLLLLPLIAAGCAGYRLGPTSGAAAGSQDIAILPFVNHTFEPRLSEAVQSALTRSFQEEGTFRVVRKGHDDVRVTGKIIRYERSAIAYNPEDVRTVTDFRAYIVTEVKVIHQISGRTIIEDEFWGRTTVRLQGDQPSAERQALPLIAKDLSRNIMARLVDGDW